MIRLVFDKLRTKQFLISSSYWGGGVGQAKLNLGPIGTFNN